MNPIFIVLLSILAILLLVALAFIIKYIKKKYPLLPKIEQGKKHIACIGDSITFGSRIKKKKDTWCHILEQKLGEKTQVLNYGLSGRTLQDEGDMPYRKSRFYKNALNSNADVYIIMLGTNDSKPYNWDCERYKKEFDNFIKCFRQKNPTSTFILMTPPTCFPVFDGKVGYDISKEIINNDIAPFIRAYASTNDLKLLDLNCLTSQKSDWFVDGVHPNEKGSVEIANIIYDFLINMSE